MLGNGSFLNNRYSDNRFEEDDEVFQKYHRYISKSEDTSFCDSSCKRSTLCGIKKHRPGDSHGC